MRIWIRNTGGNNLLGALPTYEMDELCLEEGLKADAGLLGRVLQGRQQDGNNRLDLRVPDCNRYIMWWDGTPNKNIMHLRHR